MILLYVLLKVTVSKNLSMTLSEDLPYMRVTKVSRAGGTTTKGKYKDEIRPKEKALKGTNI